MTGEIICEKVDFIGSAWAHSGAPWDFKHEEMSMNWILYGRVRKERNRMGVTWNTPGNKTLIFPLHRFILHYQGESLNW
ncbi:hypothetical protein [uncultured Methanospirillum sp.]|uniref:hypothetical protein n=1 Tax=uncultured Methanospirillum sp. TaxID=262503 RepID=UPI0029C8FF7A|nr:hypothetical protein [uncultured Methanospirillum sp.]